MHVQVDIGYDQLLKLVKQLPKNQWAQLKHVVDTESTESIEQQEMLNFLLKAPTFSKEQLDEVAKARNEISQWRTEEY